MREQFEHLTAHLWRGGDWAYWWWVSERQATRTGRDGKESLASAEKQTQWFPTSKPSPLPAPEGDHGPRHIYFGVHPSRGLPEEYPRGDGTKRNQTYSRSTLSMIAAINGVFAEFDEPTQIEDLPLAPSVIIESSPGKHHCYWLLREPFILDTEAALHRAMRIQAAWVRLVESDQGAKDLSRVLRVPGTRNVKEKYGPDYPLVVFKHYDLDCLSALEEIESRVQHLLPVSSISHACTPEETDGSKVEAALQAISVATWNDYKAWVAIGMALHAYDSAGGLSLWDGYSRQSSKYQPGDCERKWPTFGGGSITVATLFHYATQDTPGWYAAWPERSKPRPIYDAQGAACCPTCGTHLRASKYGGVWCPACNQEGSHTWKHEPVGQPQGTAVVNGLHGGTGPHTGDSSTAAATEDEASGTINGLLPDGFIVPSIEYRRYLVREEGIFEQRKDKDDSVRLLCRCVIYPIRMEKNAHTEECMVVLRVQSRQRHYDQEIPNGAMNASGLKQYLGAAAGIHELNAREMSKFLTECLTMNLHGAIPYTIAYPALGWECLDGRWHYLVNDGSIMQDGTASPAASLPDNVQGNWYALCGDGDPQAGAAAWRSFLDGQVCPQHIALLLASCAVLPLLHRWMESTGWPIVWLYQQSGARKTALIRASVLALWGCRFTSIRGDGSPLPNWGDTWLSIILALHTFRDAPTLVDDYKESYGRLVRESCTSVLHMAAEGRGRGRATPRHGQGEVKPSRGLLLVTGEQEPPMGDSGVAGRVLQVLLPFDSVDTDALANLQAAGRYGHLVAFWREFIQYLASHLDAGSLDQILPDPESYTAHHGRVGAALTQLRRGWICFSHWLEQRGYISSSERQQLDAAHQHALLLVAQEQTRKRDETSAAVIFLESLGSVLRAGYYLEEQAMGCPQCGEVMTPTPDGGWICQNVRIIPNNDCDPIRQLCRTKIDGQRVLGFKRADGSIILNWKAAAAVVQDQRRRAGQPLVVTEQALLREMVNSGLAETSTKHRNPARGSIAVRGVRLCSGCSGHVPAFSTKPEHEDMPPESTETGSCSGVPVPERKKQACGESGGTAESNEATHKEEFNSHRKAGTPEHDPVSDDCEGASSCSGFVEKAGTCRNIPEHSDPDDYDPAFLELLEGCDE